MRAEVGPWRKCAALIAVTALGTGGCARLPSTAGVTTMSMSNGAPPAGGPMADPSGESDIGPGTAALAVLPPSEVCQDIMILFCLVFIPIAVPAAAIFGAVAKTTQKLPVEQVVELNRVSADVAGRLNLAGAFDSALQAEARLRGIALGSPNAGANVFVDVRSLTWNIKSGNRVALRMEIRVAVDVGDARGSRQLTYRSPAAKVGDWIADDGRAIRLALEDAMVGAGSEVWGLVLGVE